jgi:putative tricarboxylic transport membrane protein
MSGTRLVGLVLAAIGVLAAAGTMGYPAGGQGVPGPALFPRIIAALLVVCGVWLVWRPGAGAPLDVPPGRPRAIAWTMVLLVAYVALWSVVPFVPRTALMLLAFLRLLDVSWRGALLTAALMSVVLFVVFERLLAVRL